MIQVHDLRQVPADTVEAWAYHIGANMRQSDIDEVRASSDLSPHQAIVMSLNLSTIAFCVVSDTHGPCAMFGAAPGGLPGLGIVWMLGTEGIRREGYSIAKQTRSYFETLNEAYPILWNYIDGRNSLSMRWLRWGGFELLAEHPEYGPEGRPFFTFARTKSHVRTSTPHRSGGDQRRRHGRSSRRSEQDS